MAKRSKKQAGKRKNRRGLQSTKKALRDKVRASERFADDDIIFVSNADIKMSEVILEFAQPVLERAETDEQWKKGLCIAIVAWNAALLKEAEREEMIDAFLSGLSPAVQKTVDGDEALKTILLALIARKAEYFPDENRFIVSYEVSGAEPNLHLAVASTL